MRGMVRASVDGKHSVQAKAGKQHTVVSKNHQDAAALLRTLTAMHSSTATDPTIRSSLILEMNSKSMYLLYFDCHFVNA